MSEMPAGFLEVLHAAADAVVAALADHQDWGPSGRRAGQYAFDLTADAAAVQVLHDGGLRVLSEESGADPGPGPVAVLDPVDGSTNASRGIRYYATSICVVNDGEPVAAVVHHHGTGDRYDAACSGGARLNGSTLVPRTSRPLREAIVAVNGLPPGPGGWAQFRTLGAAALEICAVADGRLDGYVDFSPGGLGSWDYLGALLVCSETGVEVSDAMGRDLIVLDHESRRAPVAAPRPLIRELMEARARLYDRRPWR